LKRLKVILRIFTVILINVILFILVDVVVVDVVDVIVDVVVVVADVLIVVTSFKSDSLMSQYFSISFDVVIFDNFLSQFYNEM